MSALTRLFAMLGRLPRAETHRIEVERDLVATMPDGVELFADRFYPVRRDTLPDEDGDGDGPDPLPIILLRAPYGRGGFAALIARLFAERGYQAVLQEVRGTGVSGGEFDAFRNERADGLATLDWLATQPWFTPNVGMTGLSYLGVAQYAVAADAPDFVKAFAIQVSASEFRNPLYHGGTFALYTSLRWAAGMGTRTEPMYGRVRGWLRNRNILKRALWQLPLAETDSFAAGQHVGFFQDWLEHDQPGDPFWDPVDHSRRLAEVRASVSLLGGWFDILILRQLADYAALRDAGRDVRLTVGPWHHVEVRSFLAGVRDSLEWMDLHLRGAEPRRPRRSGARVRIKVMGHGKWRLLPDWPPPSTPQRWHLIPGRGLALAAPTVTSQPARYRYDPSDPTPSVGGVLLRGDAGSRDDRKLERRADVLTFTSEPLEADLEAIGTVSAEIFARASRPYFDLFVRVCDVDWRGRSRNVCDGPVRISPERFTPDGDGVYRVPIELWPTAYRFRKNHRVRVHVSSGAHPRIARNLGSGEPLASGTTLTPVDIEILHDPAHPSAVVLPVVPIVPGR